MFPQSDSNLELGRVEKILIGNGREGLIPQVARIEEKLNAVKDVADEAKGKTEKLDEKGDEQFKQTMAAITALTIEVTKLTGNVEAHQKSMHLKDLLKKPLFYTLLFIGLVALIEIIEFSNIGLPWIIQAGSKLLGI